MEFVIRNAEEEDLGSIMEIMEAARKDAEHSKWFVADEEGYVREHLTEKGFVVLAQAQDGRTAGFFLIKFPEEEDPLGKELDFSGEELEKAAVMDSAAVADAFRGNGLQGRMLRYAQEQLVGKKYTKFLCTIHPDNIFSLKNMQKAGYEIKKTIYCYGGLKRCLLLKEI